MVSVCHTVSLALGGGCVHDNRVLFSGEILSEVLWSGGGLTI